MLVGWLLQHPPACFSQPTGAQASVLVLLMQADRDILKEVVDSESLHLERATTACQLLIEGHAYRIKEAKRVRTAVFKGVNGRFNDFLKRRRHSGRIQIDYHEHTLDMEVEPIFHLVNGAWSVLTVSNPLQQNMGYCEVANCLEGLKTLLDHANGRLPKGVMHFLSTIAFCLGAQSAQQSSQLL